ncbi:MAG: hypothetical protein ACI84A_000266 [Pontimonas sp.]|jgi:hypothetical protein
MVRWIVIGGVAAVAFTIYALVDLFMTHAPRVRAFPKPLWIVVIVVLPIIGPLLWLRVGKAEPRIKRILGVSKAPDDDPKFLGSLDSESSDERIKRLEEELRKLDEDDPPTTGDDDDQDPPPTRS